MSLSILGQLRPSLVRSGSLLSRRLSEYPKLLAQLRLAGQAGSRKSRQLRQEKQVPGVVYGLDDDGNVLKRMVVVDQLALTRELSKQGKSFENTLYELEVQAEENCSRYLVVPRQVQLCPVTDTILSVNFLRYRAGVSLRIPIELRGAEQSPDVKRGGYVVPVKPFLSCVVQEGAAVPRTLTLDLSTAQKGQVFRVAHLSLPANVRPARGEHGDRVLAVVKAAKG